MEQEIRIHNHQQFLQADDLAEIKDKRRSLLKYAFFGGGFFMIGKILGPSINFLSFDNDFGKVTNFKNFRLVESNKELRFFDKMGNEILTLDREL